MKGKHLYKEIDEQIIFNQLDVDENAIWSLFLASGYLKAESCTLNEETGGDLYELALTNKEVQIMFQKMIRKWFSSTGMVYNGFIKSLLQDDVKSMNAYMNRVALATFSYFDSGRKSLSFHSRLLHSRNGYAFILQIMMMCWKPQGRKSAEIILPCY